MPYLLEKSRFGINFFAKRNTILLLYVYQVFIFLQDHLHFFLHFFFTFMEQLFLDDPISFCNMLIWTDLDKPGITLVLIAKCTVEIKNTSNIWLIICPLLQALQILTSAALNPSALKSYQIMTGGLSAGPLPGAGPICQPLSTGSCCLNAFSGRQWSL